MKIGRAVLLRASLIATSAAMLAGSVSCGDEFTVSPKPDGSDAGSDVDNSPIWICAPDADCGSLSGDAGGSDSTLEGGNGLEGGDATAAGWADSGDGKTAEGSGPFDGAVNSGDGTANVQRVPLTINFHALGQPTGAISSAPSGLSCAGQNCSQTVIFDVGTTVAMTVSGLTTGALSAWSNGCTGTSCTVTLNAALTVSFTSTVNNIVFVTSSLQDGSFGGIGPGDALCNSLAGAAGVPGRFVAFVGTSTVNAFSRLTGVGGSVVRGWIRPDGLAFGDTIASLESNAVWYPISRTEQNTPLFIGVSGVWTGQAVVSPTATLPATNVCNDWTTNINASSFDGTAGVYTGEGRYWQTGNGLPCNSKLALLCFGTDFNQQVTLTAQNGLATTGRHVFVSNMLFTGALGGTGPADLQCQSEASAANLGTPANFMALITTPAGSAASRFNLSGSTWIRPDGVMVATTTTDFMNGNLLAPLAMHADGSLIPIVGTWLGSSLGPNAAGTAAETCSYWTTAASTSSGWIANPLTAGYRPWNAASVPCSSILSVVCLEN